MRGILLDIEGTTTPIAFVYEVLFPYARRRLRSYTDHAGLTDLRLEYEQDMRAGNNPPEWSTDSVPYLEWLMDRDRKSTALKRIQGEIWLKGFQNGELHGEVFDDVPPAFERWRARGIEIRIFSSGSVLAQRLLFSTTSAGDLTRFISAYFDTTTGPKNEPASYTQIAQTFGIPASEIVFISDAVRELDAAKTAGMTTLLCIRPGNAPQPHHTHATVAGFGSIE
jgi:enolase-phosphatase E1